MAFSVACVGGVVVVLLATDNKPEADWKLPIHPNALVSVFNTLAKSAMLFVVAEGISQLKWIYFQQRAHQVSNIKLFDNASRGPWGSMMLLFILRWHAVLASIGAAITVLALAMDPFTQQIIHISNEWRPLTNGSASLPVTAAILMGHTPVHHQPAVTLVNGWHHSSERVLQAMRAGLYSFAPPSSFVCSTGNCMWSEFSSLGICSSCNNVTGRTIVRCQAGTQYYDYHDYNTTTCTYSTPNGANLTAIFASKSRLAPVGTLLSANAYFSAKGAFDISFIRFGSNYYESSNVTERIANGSDKAVPVPQAYDCGVRFCEITSAPSYHDGKLIDNATKEVGLRTPKELCSMNETRYTTDPHQLLPADVSSPPSSEVDVSPLHHKYMTDCWSYSDLISAAWNFFHMSLIARSTFVNGDASAFYWENDGDIPRTLQNVVRSVNNYIRQGPDSTRVEGTAWISEPYIHIQWSWLVLPVSLVFLSALFLGLSICFSMEKSKVIWKSSSLAMLFHGLSDGSQGEPYLRSLGEMDGIAHRIWARLAEDDKGGIMLVRS